MIRAPRLLLATVLLATALTACGPADPAPTNESAPSATATPSATSSATPTASAPASAVSAPPCTRDDLTNEFAFTDGTAGHLHGILTVGNRGAAPCSLSGYPTVVVGEPEAEGGMGAVAADDPGDPGAPVDLQPGDAAVAAITIVQAGNVEGCTIVETDYLVYAPPGVAFGPDTTQHVYTQPFSGCRNEDIALVTVGGFAAG